MSTVLWIWEFGGGLGHTLPLRPLALALGARGHRNILAIREFAGVLKVFAPHEIALLQAPVKLTPAKNPAQPPATYADILTHHDFQYADELSALLAAWRTLFETVKPDLIVLDHSPTALLALRGTKYKKMLLGHGFFCPPNVYPLPNLRAWQPFDADTLRRTEDEVLAGMNGALARLNAPPLKRIGELFADADANALCTLPELDHYRQRLTESSGSYWGHWSLTEGAAPRWPDVPGPRVFAYLKRFAGFEHVLRMLAASGHPTLVYLDGLSADEKKAYASPSLVFAEEFLDFSRVASECSVAILNATHYSMLTFLLAGVPLVQIPLQLEQLLSAHAAEQLGASVTVLEDRMDAFVPALQRVLTDATLRTNAQRFAARYQHMQPRQQGERFIEFLDALLSGRALPELPKVPPAEVRALTDAPVVERPVFIVSAPRAGDAFLFESLAHSPGFATVCGAKPFEAMPELRAAAANYDSDGLTSNNATPDVATRLKTEFARELRDVSGQAAASNARLLDSAASHALRISFLNAAFPDALFIYLYRDPEENIAEIAEAWESGAFVSHPALPGWKGPAWSFALPAGWRELAGRSVAEIAAAQWKAANAAIIDGLEGLPPERWCAVRYADLRAEPAKQIERLCRFVDVPTPHTVPGFANRPAAKAVTIDFAGLEALVSRVNDSVGQFTQPADAAKIDVVAPTQSAKATVDAGPIACQSTTSFPELLKQLNASVLVTTYQANKLFIARELQGQLNTHFRTFHAPMGLAVNAKTGRLAIGAKQQVWEFQNQPAVSAKVEPRDRHDACFMPRAMHHTGDISVHDLAWAGTDLWLVNTRFSCLCTLDREHSFVPRWRPPFISALAPEDRCHLNGLATVDGRPRFVTALGMTDTANGWRANKANGGVLMDVPSGNILLRGLSMPHSPRWHQDKLWLLESGTGALLTFDPKRGQKQEVCRLPGFTRGLDFFGPFVFIGLSQVRESAVFAGLPITERFKPEERACGVWVVDTRNGQTVAFLRFSSGVQEIFAVQCIPARFPDVFNDTGEAVSANSFVLPDSALQIV